MCLMLFNLIIEGILLYLCGINYHFIQICIFSDLIDTGVTLSWVKNYLSTKGCASVSLCCLLDVCYIIDTGVTLSWVKNYVSTKGCASVSLCCLLDVCYIIDMGVTLSGVKNYLSTKGCASVSLCCLLGVCYIILYILHCSYFKFSKCLILLVSENCSSCQ